MLKGRPSRLIIAAIVLAVIVGGYYGVRAVAASNNGALKASGTIESEISIRRSVSACIRSGR